MELIEVADSIKSMHIRGAGQIARSAAQALMDEALAYKGNDLDGFRRELEEGKKL